MGVGREHRQAREVVEGEDGALVGEDGAGRHSNGHDGAAHQRDRQHVVKCGHSTVERQTLMLIPPPVVPNPLLVVRQQAPLGLDQTFDDVKCIGKLTGMLGVSSRGS